MSMWQNPIPSLLDAMPVVRRIWRFLLERGLEVTFHHPNYHLPSYGIALKTGAEQDAPIRSVQVSSTNPHIHAWMDCEFINHRTDRQERILSATLHLKRKLWVCWSKTLAQASFVRHDHNGPGNDALLNIELGSMTGPITVNLWADGPIQYPLEKLPKRMTLEVEFRMVGPIRTVKRLLSTVRHDPKTVLEAHKEQD